MMTRRLQYFFGVLVITPVWFAVSFWLTLMMAGAEDTMPQDLPVPLWLKSAFSIFVPVYYLLPDSFPGLSDRAGAHVFMLAMLIDSALSAFVLIFLFRLVARFFTAKKREVENAA
jgi:Na+-driven multidrug efflux pump